MPFPKSRVQAVNKSIPPFFKSVVRPGYFQTAAGLLCLCLCGLSMEREGKGKVGVQPLHGPHSVQAQEPGGEVDGVSTNITHPAPKATLVKAHRGVLIRMEGAECPPSAVKGQAKVSGGILGAHSFPDFPENISQGPLPFRLPAPSAKFLLRGVSCSWQTAVPLPGHLLPNSRFCYLRQ